MKKSSIDLDKDWTDAITDYGLFFSQVSNTEEEKDLNLVIDWSTLDEHEGLTEDLSYQPIESLNAIKTKILEDKEFRDIYITVDNFEDNTADRQRIRHMRASDINTVVVFSGIVRTATTVAPRLKRVSFVCDCGGEILVEQVGEEEIGFKGVCPYCNNKENAIRRADSRCQYTNFMKCVIEEDPEGLRNKQPERMDCEIIGPLTDEKYRIGTGDRVLVLGVYRVRKKTPKTLNYEKYINVLGIIKKGRQYEELKVSPEEEKQFEELSKNPNLWDMISSAIAPNIFGHTMEKKAMVLQAFGGNLYSKERRGDIHLLLVGDPSIGKSKMIESITKTIPQVVRASGAPTTQVGLTACVRRDEDTGEYYLEAGAAVLADGGLLIIDEFDKMKDDARGALHEVMEEQKVTVTKATISAEMPSRCSILAIMNPKGNRFNDSEPLKDQVNLVPSMLSRFDLIFALRDVVDRVKDEKIADTICDAREGSGEIPAMSYEYITKYILYARSKVKEIGLPQSSRMLMKKRYTDIREMSNATKDMISITARQFEGLCRLAEAHAKMRLSSVVEREDAECAITLLDYYLNTMCKDEHGRINSALINGSETPSEIKSRMTLMDLIIDETNFLRGQAPEGYVGKTLLDTEKIYGLYRDATGFPAVQAEKEFKKEISRMRGENLILSHMDGAKLELVQKSGTGGTPAICRFCD